MPHGRRSTSTSLWPYSASFLARVGAEPSAVGEPVDMELMQQEADEDDEDTEQEGV